MSSSNAPVRTVRFDETVAVAFLAVPGRTMSALEGRVPTPYPQSRRILTRAGLVFIISDHSEQGEQEEVVEEDKDSSESSDSSDSKEHSKADVNSNNDNDDETLEELLDSMLREQHRHAAESDNEFQDGANFDSWLRTQQLLVGQFPVDHHHERPCDVDAAADAAALAEAEADVCERGATYPAHLNVTREPRVFGNDVLDYRRRLKVLEDCMLKSE